MSSVLDELPAPAGTGAARSTRRWVNPRVRHPAFVSAAFFAVVLLTAAGGLAWRNARIEQRAADEAVAAGRAATSRAAQTLDAMLRAVPLRIDDLRGALENGDVRPDQVPALLTGLLETEMAVSGYGVAFEPDVAGTRLFAPYIERGAARSMPLEIDLGTLYDYTDFRYGWYRNTLLDGAGWQETNIFPDTGDVAIIYAVPFTLPGATTRQSGVVFAAIPLEAIAGAIGSIGGTSGYAFLISKEGRYLVHPREELVHGQATLFTTAWTSGNTLLHTLGVRAIQGETVFAESQDEVTGRVNWTFAQPVRTTGWSVFAVFFRDEFGPDTNWERQQLFVIITCALGGIWLILIVACASRVESTTVLQWASAVSLALVLTGGIAALWWVADRFPPALPELRQVVLDEGSAHQFLMEAGMDDATAGPAAPVMIPTGVFVRAISIQSGSEVSVSGFVWQRYEIGRHDRIPRGFMFPEVFDPEQMEISEVYKERVGGEERIGWFFAAKFRQPFDYGRFPFDRQSVWVRLRPASLANNVVFVPDFNAYDLMNPSLRPGVDSTMVLSGWDVISSYFDYRMHRYNASVGLPMNMRPDGYPELFFNVEIRRQFLGPFVTYLVPLAVTASMLFALLLISSRREAQAGMLGFSAAEIVLGAAALFFVVSFQHSTLRDSLNAAHLIYFEYFYFGLYGLLMLVSINAILFASAVEIAVVEYQDNLIPKLMFWPLVLLGLFTLTLSRFY